MRAARREVQRAARSHPEQSTARIEDVEERKEVALVGAAAVEEDEQTFGLGCRRTNKVASESPRSRPRKLPARSIPLRHEALELGLVPPVHEVRMCTEAARRDLRAERHGRVERDEDDLRHRHRMDAGQSPREEYFRCCL